MIPANILWFINCVVWSISFNEIQDFKTLATMGAFTLNFLGNLVRKGQAGLAGNSRLKSVLDSKKSKISVIHST